MPAADSGSASLHWADPAPRRPRLALWCRTKCALRHWQAPRRAPHHELGNPSSCASWHEANPPSGSQVLHVQLPQRLAAQVRGRPAAAAAAERGHRLRGFLCVRHEVRCCICACSGHYAEAHCASPTSGGSNTVITKTVQLACDSTWISNVTAVDPS